MPAMPMPMPELAIKEMVPIEEEEDRAESPELNVAESAGMDWYDTSYEENANAKLPTPAVSHDKLFAIGTPRFSVVSMATPREPASGAAQQGGRQAFVPHWPYSSQWPFCRAPTTLELRGLPRSLTVQAFIAQLDSWDLASRCNFVHLQTGGRAIVNLERHADGRELAGLLHGFSAWKDCEDSSRPCRVAWSFSKQGLEELLGERQEASQVWRPNGRYTGPWAWFSGSWMPVVHPPEEKDTIWVPIRVAIE